MDDLFGLFFSERQTDGGYGFRAIAMTIGAMGITLAGAVAAFSVYVLNQLSQSLQPTQELTRRREGSPDSNNKSLTQREQLRISGMLPILFGSLVTVAVMVGNAILTAMIVAQNGYYSRWWTHFSAGLVWFAVLAFLLPLARTFITDSRTALSLFTASNEGHDQRNRRSAWWEDLRSFAVGFFIVGLGINGLLLVANVVAFLPLIVAVFRFDKPWDSPYGVSLLFPSVAASLLTVAAFEASGYRALVRLSRERSGIMLCALTADQRVLIVKKQEPPFANQWTLPRAQWDIEKDRKSLVNTANRRAGELSTQWIAPGKIASGRKRRLYDLFHSQNVAGLPNIEIYEVQERIGDGSTGYRSVVTMEKVPTSETQKWLPLDEVLKCEGLATHVEDFLRGLNEANTGRPPRLKYWTEDGEIGAMPRARWKARFLWFKERF